MEMFTHARLRERTMLRVQRGQHVLLSGDVGSGKSTVLRSLREPLRAAGRSVVELSGVGDAVALGAFLKHTALAPGSTSRFGPSEATESLLDLVGGSRATILIDDVHRLDAASMTVIDTVLRQHPDRLSIVATVPYAAGSDDRWASVLCGAATDQIPALGVADVVEYMGELLGGQVEGGLAAAIAGRSGGIPRVVQKLTFAAFDNHAITNVHGRWAQTGVLDNVPTRSLMDGLMAQLDDQLREGLELIAWFGLMNVTHARRILGDDCITGLDRAGRLAVFERPAENAIAVSPPVLANSLRLHLSPTRRAVFRARLDESLGVGELRTPERTLPAAVEPVGGYPEDAPAHQQVTVLAESVRTKASLWQKTWDERRDVASALPLLRLRLLDGLDTIDVDRVFAETAASTSDRSEHVGSYALLRGQWQAYCGGSFVDGLRSDSGPSGTLVAPEMGQAFLHRLVQQFDPEATTTTLSMADVDDAQDVPPALRGIAAIVRVEEALEAGAPDQALDVLDQWQGARMQMPIAHQLNALRGDALLMVGQVDDSIAWSRRRLSDAYDELSPFSVRVAARGLATALFIAGESDRALRALSVVLRIGRCGPVQSPFDERVFALAAVLHARDGHHGLAQTLLDELDATPRTSVPPLDFVRPWAHAEVASALTGAADAEPLWRHGEELWATGRRASAAFSWAMTPTTLSDARLNRLTAAFATMRIPLLAPVVRLHETIAHGTTTEIADAAQSMVMGGAIRTAAAEAAQQRATADGAAYSDAAYTEIAGRDVRASVPQKTSSANVTAREQEIIDLVREGLSNREIAGRLFLSVRTIESHVYRAMQKLAVNDRSQLARAGS
ncbi:LuxR C-terminal-related transcriptional regulator [Paramicrobacterium fandaimingii]|uniref:LuxR C-terminal-related transcriptional regulator n=1 Tax=Paramicrobacterium fandaimingii TaxID=2708079 RepID=UPI00141F75A6|nr:LuxR C-terminal-related transcriptional regulator [Microbacterium fandaimingii]